jgi:hypothetical protein
VLAVIIGSILMLVGLIANWYYLREIVGNRGPLRRRDP